MKLSFLFTIAIFGLIACASAATFDVQGFGAKLNGWGKDGTAAYGYSGTTYKTHKPVVTPGKAGAIRVTTQVDVLAYKGKGASCELELGFNRAGTLQTIQIKGRIHGQDLDTAVVRREDHALQSLQTPEAGGEGKAPKKKLSPSDAMVEEVIRRFDLEAGKLSKGQPPLRRDLFSRLSKQSVETADLSGGLRYNVKLMLQHVRGQ